MSDALDTIHIKFKKVEDFFSSIEKSLNKRDSLIQPKNELYFDSIKSFHKFLTHTKIEVLAMIKQHKPSSIYQLSQMLKRPQSAVLRDVNALESVGFIKFTEGNDKRKTKVPNLVFNYSIIKIHNSNVDYSINIPDAA